MRLLDFFFALRPLVLVPAWSFFLLGHGAAQRDSSSALGFPALRLALLTGVLVAAYLVNQVVDFETDRVNAKGFFLQRGIFTRRLYLTVATASLLVALAVAVLRDEMLLLLGVSAGLSLAYSVSPLRLAARPGLDLVANAVGYGGLALLLGAGLTRPPSAIWVWRVLAGALAVGAVFLHTTLLDLEGDRRTGKITSGVVLGALRARALAALCAGSAVVAGLFGREPVLSAACALLTLVAGGALMQPLRLQSRFVCVFGSAIFAVAAGYYVPVFLAVIFVLVLLTRLYYKQRFGLAYPAL